MSTDENDPVRVHTYGVPLIISIEEFSHAYRAHFFYGETPRAQLTLMFYKKDWVSYAGVTARLRKDYPNADSIKKQN